MRNNRSVATVERAAEVFGDDTQKLIRELKRLVREGKRSGDFLLMGAAYCRLAEVCHAAGDLNGIFSNALKAVTLLKDSDEYELIAKAYSALGQAYTNQENHQMALASDEIAYQIVRKHRIKGDTRLSTLNNLSASYHMMGEVRKSIRLLNECIELLREGPDGNDVDLAMYSLNLAEYHKDNNEPDAALKVLRSMSSWIETVAFPALVCDYYLRCAILFYSLGDLAAGDRHTDTAFTLVPENIYPLPVYDDLRQLAHFLSKNGDRSRAERVLGLMTVFAEKNTGTVEQIIAIRMMADFYRQFGDCERASECYASYEAMNERHMRELRDIQLKLHRTTHNTELEIRRLKQKMRQSQELASLDPMTKLLNRSALLRVSSEFIGSAAGKKQKIGAIFIDIDFFKECNDTYGHARGDEIIREVARICRKQEAANIRFARYGGDEFFGITRGLTDDEVSDIARRISTLVRNADIPHVKNPNGGRITLSVGVVNVAITDKTNTILEIANYADKAMYHAKNAGKNAIYRLDHSGTAEKETGASFVRIEF